MIWFVLAFLGITVWVLLYGRATMDYIEGLLDPPLLERPQPNEDDPAFMAHVERKLRHLED